MARLMGAVQRGKNRTVTYFYLGNADVEISKIQRLCDVALRENTVKLAESSMLCTALELSEDKTNHKIIGFAFMNPNGRIVILTTDGFYKEYIGEFAKEAIIYYEYGKQ